MNTNKPSIRTSEISVNNSALIAGIGLLLMAIIAPVANFAIIQKLYVIDDAAQTFNNISSSTGLFRTGITLFLLVALLDIIVAWALYIFLRPVNKYLSLLTAWLRIVYATILLVALISLINVFILMGRADYLSGFSSTQLNSQVMLSLDLFNRGWEFGLIIFGFHLLLLGYLFFKAAYMKKILGVLIILAALGYLVDGLGKLLSAHYSFGIGMFTFVGEIVLIFWLLIRGRKIEG